MAGEDNKTMKFSREDSTQRREGAGDAKEEKGKELKKPLKQKLSYPKAQKYNDELTNNNSASLRLCEKKFGIVSFASLRLCERKFGIVSFAPQRLCERKFGIVSFASQRLCERKFGIKSSASLRLCVSILFTLVLISCQTMPDMSGNFTEDANYLPLENSASIYIIADAKKARPVINLLPIRELSDRQVVQILEKTDVLAVALFPQTSGRRYQIAAWGNYPSFQAGLALGSNSAWQKQRSAAGGNYWHSQANRLSVAMSSRQVRAVVSANSEPADPVTSSPGMEIPEGFNEFRRGSIFSCWLESPSLAISRIMNDLGLPFNSPVKKLFISLVPAREENYEAIIRLQFENASFARAMTAILNTAYGFLHGNTNSIIASILFANPPSQNGNNVDIRTAALNEERIVQLLGLFTLF